MVSSNMCEYKAFDIQFISTSVIGLSTLWGATKNYRQSTVTVNLRSEA